MAFRYSGMGSRVVTAPGEAAAELRAALEQADQNQVEVARRYGVHRDTLARWLDALEAAGEQFPGRGTAKRGRKAGVPQQKATPEEPRRGRMRRHPGASAAA